MSGWMSHLKVYVPAARAGTAYTIDLPPSMMSPPKTLEPSGARIVMLCGAPSGLSNEIVSAVFAATSSSAVENLMSFAEMLTAAGETPGCPDGAAVGATDGAAVGADEPPQAAAARATADSA